MCRAHSRWPNPRLSVGRESVAGVTESITGAAAAAITGQLRFQMASATALLEATTNGRTSRAPARAPICGCIRGSRHRPDPRAWSSLSRGIICRSWSNILEKRERAGDLAAFDRLRAQREVIDFEAEGHGGRRSRARARPPRSYFAAGKGSRDDCRRDPVISPVTAAVSSPRRPGRADRGEVLALQAEIESAAVCRTRRRRRRVPEPEVLGGTNSSSVGAGDIGADPHSGGFSRCSTAVDRSGRARRQRTAAATARLEIFRITLGAEIAAWRAAALARRSAADRYRASALTTAADVERIARVSYDAGERGILELLDAYRTSASARVRQAALDASAREAEIELEFTSGWEMP